MTKVIHSQFIDFNFIKFPIIFPLIYFFFLVNYPEYENFIILFTLIFLAEPHFGATWPFMINAINKKKFQEEKFNYIFIPIFIILISIILFLYFKLLLYLIFFVANFYHVTRQSSGISKIYIGRGKDKEIKFHISCIYFFGILFFIIGFLRFQLPVIDAEYSLFLNISIIILMLLLTLKYLISYGKENLFVFLTGILIFFPVCFVDSAIHAIIMGVTMHYSQYIFITFKVNFKRLVELKSNITAFKGSLSFIIIILIYGILMGGLSVFDKFTNVEAGFLIIIPLIGQLLHFYYDSLLWKFSNSHNREVTLKYI